MHRYVMLRKDENLVEAPSRLCHGSAPPAPHIEHHHEQRDLPHGARSCARPKFCQGL